MKSSRTDARSVDVRAINPSNNRTTEKRLRALLADSGHGGWVVRPAGFMGTPDFVFPAARVAVFRDGCFWHSCPKCGHLPKSNRKYWLVKLRRNKTRDRFVNRYLTRQGFKVVRLWECEIKMKPRSCIRLINAAVSNTLQTRSPERVDSENPRGE